MSRGPLPTGNARRKNAPTIPTTVLPADGYRGEIPEPPASYDLLEPGRAWWEWAWRTPQAAVFGKGALYALARRAKLEDDLWLLERAEEFDLGELLGIGDSGELMKQIEFTIRKLKALAGGSTSILKEMRELDKRFGLDPKALAENRWTIAEPEEPVEEQPAEVRTLHAVDAA
jgi:hypothetical protein